MRPLVKLTLALIALLAPTACRSPFGEVPPEEGPDAGQVGRGIHGWPLLESAPHGAGWRTDVAWPAYSQIRTPDPKGLQQTDVLWPLIHVAHEQGRKRHGLLRPVWDLETKADGTWDLDLAWPLVKWVDKPDKHVRRIGALYSREWSSNSSKTTLFPVYWSGEKYADDPERHEHYTHVWPLWGHHVDGTEERTWLAAPLYARTTDDAEDKSTHDLLFPLVHWGRDGDETHTRVLPLYWQRDEPDESETIVFPFWWNFEDDDRDFAMLFPFYGSYASHDGDSVGTTIGGPLYIGGRDDDEEFTWLAAPFVHWRTDDTSWDAHLFPVVWAGERGENDGYTYLWPLYGREWRGSTRETSVAWPFFVLERDDDGWELDAPWPFVEFRADEDSSGARAWPLFRHETEGRTAEGDVLLFVSTWESDAEADERDFRVLWRLVESSRQNGKNTLVVNPLFRHETNDAGDDYWSFLFGLLARKRTGDDVDWRFLWVL